MLIPLNRVITWVGAVLMVAGLAGHVVVSASMPAINVAVYNACPRYDTTTQECLSARQTQAFASSLPFVLWTMAGIGLILLIMGLRRLSGPPKGPIRREPELNREPEQPAP